MLKSEHAKAIRILDAFELCLTSDEKQDAAMIPTHRIEEIARLANIASAEVDSIVDVYKYYAEPEQRRDFFLMVKAARRASFRTSVIGYSGAALLVVLVVLLTLLVRAIAVGVSH